MLTRTALAGILLVSLAQAPPVAATLCPPTPSPSQEYARAPFVFAGVPVSVKLEPRKEIRSGSSRGLHLSGPEGPYLVTVRVTAVWRGDVDKKVVLRTWGRRNTQRVQSLYYADRTPGSDHLSVDFCGRGGPAEYALWDLYWLPEPTSVRRGPKTERVLLSDLLDAMASQDVRRRDAAIEALGHIEEERPAILSALGGMLTGHQPGDRTAAARAIALMREAGRPAEPALAWAFENSSAGERATAFGALHTVLSMDSFRPYFTTALSDTTPQLLSAACRLVAEGGVGWGIAQRAEREAGWRRLLELIRHPDPQVRAEAVGATRRFPTDGRAIVGTIDSLRNHDPVGWVRFKARGAWSDLTGRDPWEGLTKGSRGWKESSRNR